jgi:Glycosyl hydrolases family 35
LCSVVAPRQVTRGGAVVLVQQENEYYYVGRPRVKEYQASLIRQMREFGIEVPITDCNGDRGETRLADSMMTQNSGGAASVLRVRRAQPDKPVFITELYTDYLNVWGWPVSSYPSTRQVYQQTIETLAVGGMYNYFMYAVGTNFGYWAASSWKSDESFCTSRYYSRAPLGEGGGFNPSFFAAKAVNLLALNATVYLTSGEQTPSPVEIAGPVKTEAVRSPRGWLLFVQPKYPEVLTSEYHTDGDSGPFIQTAEVWPFAEIAQQPGTLMLASGPLPMAESSDYPSMLPWKLEIDPSRTIDYANASFLGVGGSVTNRVIVLRGETGMRGVVSVNGQRAEFTFAALAPRVVTVGGATILGVSHELADRTWFVEDRVIIGPSYVGEFKEGRHECFLEPACDTFQLVSAQGAITARPVDGGVRSTAIVPTFGWRARALPEIRASSEGWQLLPGGPVSVERMGVYWGYTWYRAHIRSATSRRTGLWFSRAVDRVSVFTNGRHAGIWGRGKEATRDPLPVDLQAGDNEFVFLCDNMGRVSEGAQADYKGIFGPAFVDAEVRTLPAAEWSRPTSAPSNSWPFQTYRYFARGFSLSLAKDVALSEEMQNFHVATFVIPLRPGEGLTLALSSFPAYAWVLVNGKIVGEHAGDLSLAGGFNFSTHTLDDRLIGSSAKIEVIYYGKLLPAFDSHVRLYSYRHENRLARWAFRRWTNPTDEVEPKAGEPVWWETNLARPNLPGPYFLVTEGLSKGQAFVNGMALGRYWHIGPQQSLYVPDSWLKADNRIAIFDEGGKSPDGVYLLRDSRVPTQSVWL